MPENAGLRPAGLIAKAGRIHLFDRRRGTDWSLAGRVAQSVDP
jgi:hypothetical protein